MEDWREKEKAKLNAVGVNLSKAIELALSFDGFSPQTSFYSASFPPQ